MNAPVTPAQARKAVDELVDGFCSQVEEAADSTFGGIPESVIFMALQQIFKSANIDHCYRVIRMMVATGRVKQTRYHLLVAA